MGLVFRLVWLLSSTFLASCVSTPDPDPVPSQAAEEKAPPPPPEYRVSIDRQVHLFSSDRRNEPIVVLSLTKTQVSPPAPELTPQKIRIAISLTGWTPYVVRDRLVLPIEGPDAKIKALRPLSQSQWEAHVQGEPIFGKRGTRREAESDLADIYPIVSVFPEVLGALQNHQAEIPRFEAEPETEPLAPGASSHRKKLAYVDEWMRWFKTSHRQHRPILESHWNSLVHMLLVGKIPQFEDAGARAAVIFMKQKPRLKRFLTTETKDRVRKAFPRLFN